MSIKLKHKSTLGFSLVEVGMVFGVIAVMVAGVIVGKNLYEGAQVNAVERNIKDYTQAVDKFKELYGAIPGDFSGASSYFGCTACDGNGNGLLETDADTNGDGTGDGVNETTLFWQQLRYAKLIGGKSETVGTTVYQAGPFDGTVYRVSQDESRGVTFELTGYNGTTFGYSAMKPEFVKKLDEKYDDGNPDTGSIRASNGSGVSTCKTGTSYIATTGYAACVINLSMQKEGVLANDGTATDLAQSIAGCDATNIGETRPSTTKCPTGYVGNIIESCGRTGWRISSRSCAPISCGGGFYGDTRKVACPPGYTGTITETCQQGGGWYSETDPALSCTVGGTCKDGDSMSTKCPNGYSGQKVLRCDGTSHTWIEDDSSSCTRVVCTNSGTNYYVGQYISTSTCPTGFSGTVTSTCLPDTSWLVTSNNCVPTQNVSCTPPSTRSLTCPTGMTGTVSQECRAASAGGNIWVTTEYTCSPVMCGDKPVGYIRQSAESCGSGKTGYKEEVCLTTGLWSTLTSTCSFKKCPGESAPSTYNATFTDTNAGSNGTGTCNTGYSNGADGAPVLACNADGTWGALVSGSCGGSTMTKCWSTPSAWKAGTVPALSTQKGGYWADMHSGAFSPDKQYIYLATGYCWSATNSASSCPFIRYDTTKDPSDATAWTSTDAYATSGISSSGYFAMGSDGSRYIYLSEGWDTFSRYDTTKAITDTTAWSQRANSCCNVGSTTKIDVVGTKMYGWGEGCNAWVYDTTQSFTAAGSWSLKDFSAAVNAAGGDCTKAYEAPVYDGSRYFYFPPNIYPNSGCCGYTTATQNKKFIRWDSTGVITNSASWAVFDAAALGSYFNFIAAGYDGRYVYYTSFNAGSSGSSGGGMGPTDGTNLLRYDTTQSFTSSASWEAINLNTLLGVRYIWPHSIGYDGTYIIIPFAGETASSNDDMSSMLAYDPTKTFNSAGSWKIFNTSTGIGSGYNIHSQGNSDHHDMNHALTNNQRIAGSVMLTNTTTGVSFMAASDVMVKYESLYSCTACAAGLNATFHATFPQTEGYGTGMGTCDTGYTSDPTAPRLYCNSDGTWATNATSGSCWDGVTPESYVTVTDIWDSGAWAVTEGNIYTSRDGYTWAQRTDPFGTSQINDVATDGMGTWVAVANGGKLATSTDGRTWTLQTSSFGATDIYGVAHNGQSGANSKWVAVGSSGKVATSSDAVTWTQRATGYAYNYKYIAHNGLSGSLGQFMMTDGSSYYTMISNDGITWTRKTQPGYGVSGGAMIINNRATTSNTWMVTGQDEANIYYSTNNGTSWSTATTGGTRGWGLATDGAGLWIQGANGANVKRASDGALTTWTSTNEQMPGDVNVLHHNRLTTGGLWLAGADYGEFASSSDGITWTARSFPVVDTVNDEFVWKIASSKAAYCAASTLALDSGSAITGTFAQTADSTTYTVTCPAGSTGTAVRRCSNGTWGSLVSACQITCTGASASATYHATFADTNASASATGTCNSGYMSSPSAPILACQANGSWAGSLTSGGCVLGCGSASVSASLHASCADTAAPGSGSTNVNCTCSSGYSASPSTPVLACNSDGTWATSFASGGCVANSPTAYGTLKLWLDASDTSTITKDASNRVSQWRDKSGLANHLNQATNGDKPLSGTRTLNSLNVIDFVTDDVLKTADMWGSGVSVAFPLSIFIVMVEDVVQSGVIFDGSESDTNAGWACLAENGSSQYYLEQGSNLTSGAVATTGTKIFSTEFNDTPGTTNLSKIYLNGTLIAGPGNTGTPGNMDSFQVGRWTTDGIDGAIGEVLIYSGVLSTANRQGVECYLKNKWNGTLSYSCP